MGNLQKYISSAFGNYFYFNKVLVLVIIAYSSSLVFCVKLNFISLKEKAKLKQRHAISALKNQRAQYMIGGEKY